MYSAILVLVGLLAQAAPADPAAAEREIEAKLAAGEIARAAEIAETVLAARRIELAAQPAALADALDTLAGTFLAAPLETARAWDIAGGWMREAAALREATPGLELDAAASLSTLSSLAYMQGRWDEAEGLELRALAIRRARLGESHPLVAASLEGVGVILLKQARLGAAEDYMRRALELFRAAAPPDPARVARSANALAEVLRAQDRLREAEALFREAVALVEAGGPALDETRAMHLNNLAGLYKDEGRYDEAEPLLRRSLALREGLEQPDPSLVATGCLNLAELLRLQGDGASAEPLYRRALEIARPTLGADNPELAWFLNQLAVLLAEERRATEAEALYREALALLERTLGPAHPMTAQTQHDLAGLVCARGDAAQAEPVYRAALTARSGALGDDHPDAALTRIELARCLASRTPFEPAEPKALVEAALGTLGATSAYPEARADALALRADLRSRQGDAAGAIADLEQAVAVVEELRVHSGGAEATRASYLGRHLEHYDRLAAAQLRAKRIDRAFGTVERSRARALLDQLAAARVDLRAAIPAEVLGPLERRERAALSSMAESRQRLALVRERTDLPRAERARQAAALEAELAAAAGDYRRVYSEIKNASPLWRTSLGGDPATLGEAQHEVVPAGAVLLEYVVGERESWLLVVPRDPGPATAHALEVSADAAAILGASPGPLSATALHELLLDPPRGLVGRLAALPLAPGFSTEANGGPGALETRLHALWSVLVPAPARATLGTAREAIVVPDGALHQLPFEALVVERPDGTSPVRYWVDAGPPVRYAASATLLREIGRRAATPKDATAPTLVSVADPVYDPGAVAAAQSPSAPAAGAPLRAGTRLVPLPGTAREAAEIARHFEALVPGAGVRALRGLEAREPAVREALPGGRFLHIATHGIVEQERTEMFAALALTPPPAPSSRADDDGFLHLYEVYELALRCDLAVLSACGSHAGPRVEGEGVFALSRGFVAAGAKRVVASQWPVDDDSTAALMGEFFRRVAAALGRGEEPAYAEALLAAKRLVRERPEWSSPYHWAPFVLSGVR